MATYFLKLFLLQYCEDLELINGKKLWYKSWKFLVPFGAIVASAALGGYYLVYLPWKRTEPYRDAGLRDEEIKGLFETYSEAEFDARYLEIGKLYKKNQTLGTIIKGKYELSVAKALNDLNEISLNDASLDMFKGLVQYHAGEYIVNIYGKNNLWNIVNMTEQHPEIDVNGPNEWFNLVKLLEEVPGIDKYLEELREAANQIGVIYSRGYDNIKGESYLRDNVIIPYVKTYIGWRDSGEVSNLEIADDSIRAEGQGQRILPMELFEMNMTSGQLIGDTNKTKQLELAVYNTTPNPVLDNQTPCEWLKQMTLNDYSNKSSRAYLRFIKDFKAGNIGNSPITAWPNSGEAFIEGAKIINDTDGDFMLFLYSYPDHLRYIMPELKGQYKPYCMVVLTRLFGYPSFASSIRYPTGGWHTDSLILVDDKINTGLAQYGEMLLPNHFGFVTYKQPFIMDYEGKPNEPYIDKRGADGTHKEIDLD